MPFRFLCFIKFSFFYFYVADTKNNCTFVIYVPRCSNTLFLNVNRGMHFTFKILKNQILC